jgi:hypothetical protein
MLRAAKFFTIKLADKKGAEAIFGPCCLVRIGVT